MRGITAEGGKTSAVLVANAAATTLIRHRLMAAIPSPGGRCRPVDKCCASIVDAENLISQISPFTHLRELLSTAVTAGEK